MQQNWEKPNCFNTFARDVFFPGYILNNTLKEIQILTYHTSFLVRRDTSFPKLPCLRKRHLIGTISHWREKWSSDGLFSTACVDLHEIMPWRDKADYPVILTQCSSQRFPSDRDISLWSIISLKVNSPRANTRPTSCGLFPHKYVKRSVQQIDLELPSFYPSVDLFVL